MRDVSETQDKMFVFAKILNIKDNLMQQILWGLLYTKMVIWTDLMINPGSGGRSGGDIFTGEKVF